MATLSSPGVSVQVIDESFYSPAEPGTTPLIIVASAENKLNGAGTGTAPGTIKANTGKIYLVTSQKDLVDTFGDPVFKTDANNNPIHAGELNEYGLQAAYSFLGVSNRAFIARADVDLTQLEPHASEPKSLPEDGTYWFDTDDSLYGLFIWDGRPTAAGGQRFNNRLPLRLTQTNQVVNYVGGDYTPSPAIGYVGAYAIVTVSPDNTLWYKALINGTVQWVPVGSNAWQRSIPTVVGSKFAPSIAIGDNFYLNGIKIEATAATLDSIVASINDKSAQLFGGAISAANVNNKLEIYNDGSYTSNPIDSVAGDSIVIGAGDNDSKLVAPTLTDSILGITVGSYYNPKMTISRHTQVPAYKLKDATPRPTGSVWIKTTKQNVGARWRIKRFNESSGTWTVLETGLYANNQDANAYLDKANGGLSIPKGDVYINYNYNEDFGLDDTPSLANFRLMRRAEINETRITSTVRIGTGTFINQSTYTFLMTESLPGTSVLGDYNHDGTFSSKSISFTATGTINDVVAIVTAINNAGFKYISASSPASGLISIMHKNGGDFRLKDITGDPLITMGFVEYNPINKTGTRFLSIGPTGGSVMDTGIGAYYVASNWEPLIYTQSTTAPTSLTHDGQLWYSSVVDEVDIMINDGVKWVGYATGSSPYYNSNPNDRTNPWGPIVTASVPTAQRDGTQLVNGDIWIDTSDIENYPMIYKYNADLENKPIKQRWILVDKTDQSTEDGIIFADARYGSTGETSDIAAAISTLLLSNFVDFDAPDPALYPKGMMLWNTRRSGFNVKKFVQNYIDPGMDNPLYGPAPIYKDESQEFYYPHRWVTVSANQEDGSGTFGRKAQRKVVVQQMQALVNSNQDMRDDETRVFNLLACPGYPELIGEMISLNYDRGLTAFIVGDTPARLTSDATSLLEWGTNVNLAVEDNDVGASSFDEYMAMFYPWGYTSDNYGNNVVVPPSHMMLRTIALNDQVAYPWFAPAGLRRGGITNATAVGYIDGEGEFKAVALNNGQRDTLYDAKINPITFFATSGLVNFGQKTRARSASALDRINVARLIVYLRRKLSILAKPFIFEPNDKITRDELKSVVEGVLLELVTLRAITDYLVVCDTSNNTPTRIDRNELYVDIAIVPTKAVEFIYIPLRLKNTGEINS